MDLEPTDAHGCPSPGDVSGPRRRADRATRRAFGLAALGRQALVHPDLEEVFGSALRFLDEALDTRGTVLVQLLGEARVSGRDAAGAVELEPDLDTWVAMRDLQPVVSTQNTAAGRRTMLRVPVTVAGEPYGALVAQHSSAEIGDADAALVESVAHVLGAAVERARTRRILLEGEREYAELLEQSPAPILSLDAEGRIMSCNPAGEVLVGRDALGRAFVEVTGMSAGQAQRFGDTVATVLAHRERRLVEIALLPAESGVRTVQANVGVLRRPGRRDQVQLVLRELTPRLETERERENMLARRANAQRLEALGRLAGGIVHDFNTLLAVTLNNGHMIAAATDLPERLRPLAEEVENAALRGASLTRQLLLFATRQEGAPTWVSVNQTLHDLSRLLARLLGEDVRISVDCRSVRSEVYVDPSQLDQVVMNLAMNARAAMPRGGRLELRTDDVRVEPGDPDRLPPGDFVRLVVRDEGEGMDPQTRARIFEPYFTTRESDGGTGLGLATVLGIVRGAGGAIVVKSTPGEGTEFRIYFPRSCATMTWNAAEPRPGNVVDER